MTSIIEGSSGLAQCRPLLPRLPFGTCLVLSCGSALSTHFARDTISQAGGGEHIAICFPAPSLVWDAESALRYCHLAPSFACVESLLRLDWESHELHFTGFYAQRDGIPDKATCSFARTISERREQKANSVFALVEIELSAIPKHADAS